MPEKTPGQCNYETFWQGAPAAPAYTALSPGTREAWEAAAQAVLLRPADPVLNRPEAYACPTCGGARLLVEAQRACDVTLRSAEDGTHVEREENDAWDFDDDAIARCLACQGECTVQEARAAWQARQQEEPHG